MEVNLAELVGGFMGFFLTLMVLSYVIGDNLLFRLTIYVFVGVSAGFVAAAAFYSVIWPQLLRPLLLGTLEERFLVLIPAVLSVLLFTKAIPRFSVVGAPVMAGLVGIGAATIVGGAILGTLFPQVQATLNLFDEGYFQQSGVGPGEVIFNGGLILVGTVITLASFQFGTRFSHNPTIQSAWKPVYWAGRIFVAITFGVIFAGVYVASLTVLVERMNFLIEFLRSFFVPV